MAGSFGIHFKGLGWVLTLLDPPREQHPKKLPA
jgi:hypothetical protein